jgi:hypothetical protein
MSPEVADTIAAITEPSATRPLLHNHLQRFPLWVGEAFTELMQEASKDGSRLGFDVNALCRI